MNDRTTERMNERTTTTTMRTTTINMMILMMLMMTTMTVTFKYVDLNHIIDAALKYFLEPHNLYHI